MQNKKLILVLMLFMAANLIAQNKEDRKHILSCTNVQKLKEISARYFETQATFNATNFKKQITQHNNDSIFFAQFDKDGTPVYFSLENESSAITSNVNRIRRGGITGLNLDGKGIRFGLWDSAPPRTSHQEYSGRITVYDAGAAGHHASHIAGILIASGVVPEAKGMAPAATISSYSTSNWEAEVADWAANGGMISTHSYILANPKTAYSKYGIYNSFSRKWDALSYNAPYLIMCTGASNNGAKNYNPDGSRYDLLASNKLGKNSIVVGACYDVINYTAPSDVKQAVFTSWGPTDDWRVKPDITAVGTNSYSSGEESDSDYGTGQGCSFAGPVVAGGLALLQQHYHNKNGVYMKAATAKGLILSTTHEAGEFDGPDFSNGWGLFNAEKAAELISNNGTTSQISELSLEQGSSYTTTINVDGTDTLTVAICWNDPPAAPLSMAIGDDPTPMLVNDLDLRVTGANSIYKPWKLEPNSSCDNFTDAAIKGDNYRDNIEIIEEKVISAGEYAVTITHKGTLQGGTQDFSLLINGISSNVLSTHKINRPERILLVYPVPGNGNNLNLFLKNYLEDEPFAIRLFNSQGQKVLENTFATNHIKLDIAELSPGIYILSALLNDEMITKKIILD